jgi:ABC-type multidrug transport system ATPase subunit
MHRTRATSGTALRFSGVRKRYGRTVALDGLTLEVPRGSLFGLIGPNGAGKTTTFGIASGAVRPDAGTVDVLGEGPFEAAKHAGRVTVLPQDCELSPHSSARQLLTFYARLAGMSAHAAARDADRVLELVRLADRAGARVRELSHGMRRRLAVAQALLGDPELVLLDEPTGGLDPHLVVEMRELLREQRGLRTVVVSSHVLADLEATCDHVAFVEAGRCIESGPVEAVTQRAGLVRIRLVEPLALDEALRALLADRSPRVEGDVLVLALHPGEDAATANAQVLPALFAHGARVLEVRLGESLETAYLARRAAGVSPDARQVP